MPLGSTNPARIEFQEGCRPLSKRSWIVLPRLHVQLDGSPSTSHGYRSGLYCHTLSQTDLAWLGPTAHLQRASHKSMRLGQPMARLLQTNCVRHHLIHLPFWFLCLLIATLSSSLLSACCFVWRDQAFPGRTGESLSSCPPVVSISSPGTRSRVEIPACPCATLLILVSRTPASFPTPIHPFVHRLVSPCQSRIQTQLSPINRDATFFSIRVSNVVL